MRRGGPIRFAIMVVGGWIAFRTIALWPGAGGVRPAPPTAVAAMPKPLLASDIAAPAAMRRQPPSFARGQPRSLSHADAIPATTPRAPAQAAALAIARYNAAPGLPPSPERGLPASVPITHAPAPPADRLRASAWLFARAGDGAAPLATGGQLSGGQAGARLTYRLNAIGPERLALAARLSRPLRQRGLEAAAGLDWHPLAGLPARLSVERRFRLEPGARNAWAAYAAGGIYREIAPHVVLDGYAQAGFVGLAARDLFADVALKATRELTAWRLPLSLGLGAWGAAQPGVSRLDIGPHLAARLPGVGRGASLALDGRLRVAGRARPGSGLALTLAADF